jgi:hypothetical protein
VVLAKSRAPLVLLSILLAGACRKKPAPAPKPAEDTGGVTCPTNDSLAAMTKEPGRAVQADCLVYAPKFFWTAAALSYDEKTRRQPRLTLLSGGPNMSTAAFDVAPLPTEALERLLQESSAVALKLRKPHGTHLIRLGIVAQKGAPPRAESEEVAVVLKFIAHGPPSIVWLGPADQTTLADGCLHTRTIEFESTFSNHLDLVTTSYSRAVDKDAKCPSSSSMQEPLSTKPIALKSGHAVAPPRP